MNDAVSMLHADIESALRDAVAGMGENSRLREACGYALLNGGKRLRPAIVLTVAKARSSRHSVMKAALATELFHTASLIADDLPCMDNASERRGQPALHKVFGEDVALLATYALIALGYQYIGENVVELKRLAPDRPWERVCVEALQSAARNTGIRGATGGQFLDLYPPAAPEAQRDVLAKIIHMKTTTLFETAFVFGWLFGDGDPEQLPAVTKLARHFGLSYQIADDLGDMAEDRHTGRQANFALAFGKDRARAHLREALGMCEDLAVSIGLRTEAFLHLTAAIRQAA